MHLCHLSVVATKDLFILPMKSDYDDLEDIARQRLASELV